MKGRVRVLWEPRDIWIGVYRDPANRRTYNAREHADQMLANLQAAQHDYDKATQAATHALTRAQRRMETASTTCPILA